MAVVSDHACQSVLLYAVAAPALIGWLLSARDG
jgi:hypothetical protein